MNKNTGLMVLVILILAAVGGFLYLKKPVTTNSNKITVTGIIRTAGLTDEEKQRTSLTGVDWQVTDLVPTEKLPAIYGFYLLTSDKKIGDSAGKCVKVSGRVPADWQGKQDAYTRTVLTDLTVETANNCKPYGDKMINVVGGKKQTLSGTVERIIRPAPDINYDYVLTLEKPFMDETSASGLPQPVYRLVITPSTNTIFKTIEDNIGKHVEVDGYVNWGYAESKYFLILSAKSI